MRRGKIVRKTSETEITAEIILDGQGQAQIASGIGFLDHMLEQLARHSLMDIILNAQGDLHVDMHHTTEDCGLALGSALAEALNDKAGIHRYGQALSPMDETLARVVVDCSGRPFLVWQVDFPAEKIGDMDSELFREWFHAFAQAAGLTLHVETLYGANGHHMIEACFKGLARSLRQAVALDSNRAGRIPSTKGVLGGSL